MSGKHFSLLVLLAAIWGASFLFMRVAVVSIGPGWLIETRVLLAALFLLVVALWQKRFLKLWHHSKHFFILGLVNSALPFLFYAMAARSLDASVMSVLNATAPIWGALVGRIWLNHKMTSRQIYGQLVGIAGVALLVGFSPEMLESDNLLAVLAVLGATCCYGIASNYTSIYHRVGAFDNAHGSMWTSALIILPLLLFMPVPKFPSHTVIGSVLGLGIVCTGIAYLLYFKLIREAGAASALTVTFLIPLFGILWGVAFLDEQLAPATLAGAILVLLGTALSTGFNPLRLLKSSPTGNA